MSREPRRRIAVAIEELVLYGLPVATAHQGRLLRAVQEELTLRLEGNLDDGDRRLPSSGANEHSLDAGTITFNPDAPIDPNALGRAIARAVHGGLTTWPK